MMDLQLWLIYGFFSLITYIQINLWQMNPFYKPYLNEYGVTKDVGSSFTSFSTPSSSGSELRAFRDTKERKKKVRNGPVALTSNPLEKWTFLWILIDTHCFLLGFLQLVWLQTFVPRFLPHPAFLFLRRPLALHNGMVPPLRKKLKEMKWHSENSSKCYANLLWIKPEVQIYYIVASL